MSKINRRKRPKVFTGRITIRINAGTKQALDAMGHVESRRFTVFARQQIETALQKWQAAKQRQ